MGYEKEKFVDDVNEELICAICKLILKDPVQIRKCEHCFCSECMHEWWKHRHTCPVDNERIASRDDIISPHRIVRNMLSRLKVTCDNIEFGCTETVCLENLPAHLERCEHNPQRMIPCDKGCGFSVPYNEMEQHNCIEQLHQCLRRETERVTVLERRVEELEHQLVEQRNEMTTLNRLVSTMRTAPIPSSPSYPDDVERAIQTSRWLSTLRPARIRRWGGMISTPDTILQSIIQRGLVETNCPPYLVNELMESSHERRWPTGLSTLETRQMNRRRYEQYVTKRVPGKQAILIMSCENEHMGESMIVSPGMVMIFAHGVE